jgi:hypothetical protein
MGWSEPTTSEQIRYFNKHAAERKLFGWFLWAILAIWAIADFYGFKMLFTESLPPALEWLKIPATIAILIALHLSLYTTATTFFFDKLDSNEKTDSTIWIPLAITVLMLFASREGSKAILQSMAPKASIATTTTVDQDKSAKLTAEKQNLDGDLAALDALYTDRVKSAAQPHKDAIARHRRSLNALKWDEKARRSTLLSNIRKEEEAMSAATARLLAEKSEKQELTMKRYEDAVALVTGSHTSAVQSIESANRLEVEAEETGRMAANRYSWLISILLAGLFWAVSYRWVAINVQSGIIPEYEFTEFDKAGGPASWLQTAVADAWRRQMFRFSVWLHATLSSGARDLKKLDGRVAFNDPGDFDHTPTLPDGSDDEGHKVKRMYARHDTPAQIGSELQHIPVTVTNETLVITKEYTDAKAELARLLQRIQIYHSKWKSDVGATATIINNLIEDWAAATRIVTSTPDEVLGEQVERFHRVADLEYEMLKTPRAKDVKKEAAA